MRRFHRWFGLLTGLFLAFISATGIALQVLQLLEKDADSHHKASHVVAEMRVESPDDSRPVAAAHKEQRAETDTPREDDEHDLHDTLMHIHSGEFFGKGGTVVGLLCGCALFFFSLSGTWMYWQMFRARAKTGRRELLWK